MGSLRFDHVALPIDDVPASRRFYSDVLGLSLIQALSGDDWGGKPWLMMIYATADGRALALCAVKDAARPPPEADTRHYAFSAASDAELNEWRKRLSAAQVEHWEEDHGTQRSLYFRDPNGVVLEITTPSSDVGLEPDPRAAVIVEEYLRQHSGG
jgi:glyoxylase I family protein